MQHARRFITEHLTWLSLCGVVAVVSGFTPEEWIAHLAERLRLSGLVEGRWPPYLDIRAAIVAVGVGVVCIDVLLNRHLSRHAARGQTAQVPAASDVVSRFQQFEQALQQPQPLTSGRLSQKSASTQTSVSSPQSQRPPTSQSPFLADEFITGSEWNMLGGSTGQTFPVKVVSTDGKTVTFKMPLGTLDVPLDRIGIVAVQGRVIRIH